MINAQEMHYLATKTSEKFSEEIIDNLLKCIRMRAGQGEFECRWDGNDAQRIAFRDIVQVWLKEKGFGVETLLTGWKITW